MLTIRPLVARSCDRKAWATLNMPLRLTAMMSCQSLITASGSAVKALRRLMPALLTRIETWPIVAPIFAATSRHLSPPSASTRHSRPLSPAAVSRAPRPRLPPPPPWCPVGAPPPCSAVASHQNTLPPPPPNPPAAPPPGPAPPSGDHGNVPVEQPRHFSFSLLH